MVADTPQQRKKCMYKISWITGSHTESAKQEIAAFGHLGGFIEEERASWEHLLREHQSRTGLNPTILELGSGLGRWSNLLSRTELDCSYAGLELSPDCVEEAKRLYPARKFLQGDIFEFDMEGFDCVVMPYTTLHFFTLDDQVKLIERILTTKSVKTASFDILLPEDFGIQGSWVRVKKETHDGVTWEGVRFTLGQAAYQQIADKLGLKLSLEKYLFHRHSGRETYHRLVTYSK